MELVETLFNMFVCAWALFAAMKIMHVALLCGCIYLVLKALS